MKQGPDAYGLKWYKIYHLQQQFTFRMITDSTGKPDEEPFRIWWGQVYQGEDCILTFQETLKRNLQLSSYIKWITEEGGEFFSFYFKDFEVIFGTYLAHHL